MAVPICLRLLRQAMARTFSLANDNAGNSIAASMEIMAMTTSSSINVNALHEGNRRGRGPERGALETREAHDSRISGSSKSCVCLKVSCIRSRLPTCGNIAGFFLANSDFLGRVSLGGLGLNSPCIESLICCQFRYARLWFPSKRGAVLCYSQLSGPGCWRCRGGGLDRLLY